jgi:hypothetical protein
LANNVSVKDATGTTQTFKTTDNTGVHTSHVNVDTTVLPTGAATEATLATRLTESDFDTKTGALTETAPATDTASSGLNGRLQRIAQRLTSLIAQLPAALVGGRLDVNLGAAPATVTVTGTVTANAGSGTLAVDSELPAAAALADNAANPTAPAVGAFNTIWDGVTWDRAPGNSTDGALVNLGANNDVVVSGTVTANLAAGTNNIGDVDVLTVPAPLNLTGGGVEASALRVTIANDSTGVVSVDDNGGSLTVDGTVTANIGTAANLTESLVDDAAFTPAVSRVLPVGFEFDDTTPDSVNEGDIGAARMSANRNQYVTIRDGAGNERGVNVTASNALTVDGSAVTQPVSGTVTANLAAGTNNIGDVDVVTVPAPLNLTGGGVEASALRVTIANDSTGVVSVDDNGGSLTIDGTVTANAGTNLNTSALNLEATQADVRTAVQLIDNLVLVEDAAAAGGESGVQVLAVRKDTGGTLASADSDFTPLQTDASGNLRVNVAAGGAGDGAILDGVSSSIKATVFDFTNSNPLAVRLTDTNGDYVGAGGGTQYTVNAVAPADPVGTALVAERDDQLSTLSEVEGDWTNARATSRGALWVAIPDTNGDPITSFGGGTQYTEDAAAAADPTGTALIMVRDDVLSAQTTADGDNVAARGTDKGELYVKHVDAIPVTDNAGSLTVDNAALSVVGGGAEASALRVTLANDSTGVVSVDDNGGSLTVDGTVAVAGVVDTELPAAAALADNTANPTAPAVGAFLMGFDGTNWDRVQMGGAASGALKVDGSAVTQPVSAASLPLPTGASTLTEQQTQTTALQLIDNIVHTEDEASADGHSGALILARRTATPANTSGADLDYEALQMNNGRLWVDPSGVTLTVGSHAVTNAGTFAVQASGDVAHDGADSGNPVKQGRKAIAHGANPTAVAANDRTDLYANRAGIPFSIGGHPNIVTIEAAYTAAQTDAALVTVAGGLKIVVTQIQMTADNANTVDVGFRVGFGATTTPTTTGVVLTHPGVAAGSGVSRGDGSGIIGIGADGEDLRITSEVPTGGSIRVLTAYYTIES